MRAMFAVLGVAVGAVADVATFDDLPEGIAGQEFACNGVVFSEGMWFPESPNDAQFAIDDASTDFVEFGFDAIYSGPNVMTAGGYVAGGAMGFVRIHSWLAELAGTDCAEGGLDVFYIDDAPGATLMLEGLVGEQVVVADHFETAGDNPSDPQHAHLAVSGVRFERLRFRVSGGPFNNGLVAAFDNVELLPTACPGDCNADGTRDVLDFVCFQADWLAQAVEGDCNADGIHDVLDFVCFQGHFQQDCP